MKKKLMILIALLALIVIVLFINEKRNEYSYPGTLELATEYPPPNEAAETASIIESLKTILEKDYPNPDSARMKRDAHPKQHGLVKAEFTVLNDIDSEFKVGIFSQPKTYKAWIRYSNLGNTNDASADSRGMAIKLLGVPGQKILPEQSTETTHDFVFMSTQNFVTKDVKGFADLLTAINAPSKLTVVGHMLTHPRLLKLFLGVRIKIASVFDVEWGSTTPYLFGSNKAVKYAVLPQNPTGQTYPGKNAPPDFLRERMAVTLKEKNILLDFYVQVQIDPEKMPIEDPRVVWSQDLSPFVKVGTINILRQEFDTPAQNLYGDQLSFTPWHALPEHKPLGGINRGRKAIYETMSKFRHSKNHETVFEPTEWVSF